MNIARRIEIDDWTGLIDGAGPAQVGIAQVVARVTERCKFVRAKLRESFCPTAASHSRPRQAGA